MIELVAEFFYNRPEIGQKIINSIDITKTKDAGLWLVIMDYIVKEGTQGSVERSRTGLEYLIEMMAKKIINEPVDTLSKRKAEATLKNSVGKTGDLWPISKIRQLLKEDEDYVQMYSGHRKIEEMSEQN